MTPTLSAARPAQSIRVPAAGSVDSGAARAVIAAPTAATGRFIQKITRQSISIRMPPASGPIASATAETAAQIPSARGCSSAGKALQTSASESDSIGAAPAPCRTRPRISVVASPAAPETTEPAAKTAMPKKKTRLRPNMSPSRPAVTTQHRDRQQIAVHHPLQRLAIGADVAANLRQRQGDDGRVEHQQEQPRAGPRQSPPLAIHAGSLRAAAAATLSEQRRDPVADRCPSGRRRRSGRR